ncbi:hypothetical protein M9Y10_014802 [Tritrichomonas musculus]|uniref:FCP1 homology domain-containing protein n=1 Tax=Tritrichomonas musculus TaxID=1915356 RepID=A0ABR2L0I9_9EUKA
MKGHIVSLYNSNDEFIASINENDQHKIINFGESNGVLAIERISQKVEEFSYLYIILDKANMNENPPKCDDIYISSNSVSSFTIKSFESTFGNFDTSLSKSNNFCLWFTFPFYSSVNSIVNLPHSQVLIVDDAKISTHAAELDVKGYNLLYKLLNTSKGNIHENDIFNCMPEDPNDLSNFVS